MSCGWIGVDLDGTVATYDHWRGSSHIGEPIQPIVELVKGWLRQGYEVRIFTARVCCEEPERGEVVRAIDAWTLEHIGQKLPVTNQKDFRMIFCVDDRAKQVIPNQGVLLEDLLRDLTASVSA